MERLMPRVQHGRYVLIPTSDQTRGHGTHSQPAVWHDQLAEFLRALPPLSDRGALLRNPHDPEWTRPAPPISHLRFETTKGSFVLELVRAWGPIGADRLYSLARLGYYDDTRVHRVRQGYIAQFGLHGDPAVNAAWKAQAIRDDPPRSKNSRGSFAFAYLGPGHPHTRNTQVYINLADNARNDAEPFTILGTVIEGMSVVDSLYSGYGEDAGGGMRQGGKTAGGRRMHSWTGVSAPRRIVRVTVSAVGQRTGTRSRWCRGGRDVSAGRQRTVDSRRLAGPPFSHARDHDD
jgi:homoserine O-acetyltransferase